MQKKAILNEFIKFIVFFYIEKFDTINEMRGLRHCLCMVSIYTQCGYLSETTRQTIDKNNNMQIEKGSLLRKLIFTLRQQDASGKFEIAVY